MSLDMIEYLTTAFQAMAIITFIGFLPAYFVYFHKINKKIMQLVRGEYLGQYREYMGHGYSSKTTQEKKNFLSRMFDTLSALSPIKIIRT